MGKQLPHGKMLDLKIVAVAAFFLSPMASEAAPRQLDCKLTTIESTADPNFAATESRSVAVIVDQEAKTIAVSQDGTVRPFDHVTFSQLTINGYTDTVSLGMDTSAGRLVLQSYGTDSNKIEFGTCNLNSRPSVDITPPRSPAFDPDQGASPGVDDPSQGRGVHR